MLETKHLKKIMREYLVILEKYEDKIDYYEQEDIKRLIGEVRLFWYRQQRYIGYFLEKIEKEDNVTYLSGAINLDIKNAGHIEYVLLKGCRLINDPLIKMTSFYHGSDEDVNFQTVNKYLKDSFYDLLTLLREYSDDFFIIPLETISVTDTKSYYESLAVAAGKMVLSFFSKEYSSVEELLNDNTSYEDIERNLSEGMNERLVLNSSEDSKLSLKEKCENAFHHEREFIPFMDSMSEAALFLILIKQHCMVAIATFDCMKRLRIMPYIRNDIVFRYFDLVFHSSINDEFNMSDYLHILVPYVLQKTFDFSKLDYKIVKQKMGDGLLVEYIIDRLNIADGIYPKIADIVEIAKEFIK